MSTIKNLRVLVEKLNLDEKRINRLEAGANMHKRFSNIEFKIIRFNDAELEVQIRQGKHMSKNYASEDILIQRANQLFKSVVPENIRLTIFAIPFKESEIVYIDANWLENKMRQANIRVKDIAEDTGLDNTNISAWVNNKRPMSQIVKALFYFYFLEKTKQSGQSNTNAVNVQDSKNVRNANDKDKNTPNLRELSGERTSRQPNNSNNLDSPGISVSSPNCLDYLRQTHYREGDVSGIFVDQLCSHLKLNNNLNVLIAQLRSDQDLFNRDRSLGMIGYFTAYLSFLTLKDRSSQIHNSLIGVNGKNYLDEISSYSSSWLFYEIVHYLTEHSHFNYSSQNNDINEGWNKDYAEFVKYLQENAFKNATSPYFTSLQYLNQQENNHFRYPNENDMLR